MDSQILKLTTLYEELQLLIELSEDVSSLLAVVKEEQGATELIAILSKLDDAVFSVVVHTYREIQRIQNQFHQHHQS